MKCKNCGKEVTETGHNFWTHAGNHWYCYPEDTTKFSVGEV